MRYPDAYLNWGHDQHRCRVEEISPGAACVHAQAADRLSEGAEVVLELPDYGGVPAEVILLPDGAIGLLFLHDSEAREAMRNWLKSRAKSGAPETAPH